MCDCCRFRRRLREPYFKARFGKPSVFAGN
jgi:hypothetical protein